VERKRWNALIVAIQKAIVASFSDTDWVTLGY